MANAHSQTQREFIVKALARFCSPRSIVTTFAALFPDTKCDENDVRRLDPGMNLIAPDLLALFKTERERVLLDPTAAPYADQRARLIALSNDADFYAGNNQLAERRAVLRQIAEELGVVGGKGAKGAPGAAPGGGKDDDLVAITRTVVDPTTPAESAA